MHNVPQTNFRANFLAVRKGKSHRMQEFELPSVEAVLSVDLERQPLHNCPEDAEYIPMCYQQNALPLIAFFQRSKQLPDTLCNLVDHRLNVHSCKTIHPEFVYTQHMQDMHAVKC